MSKALSWLSLLALLSWTLFAVSAASASGETYTFETDAQERQYRQLINELRCPKCQNQTIADSDAPLAQDLRERVYQMTMEGQSRGEIIEFMRVRYGDFVHYKPPLNASTLVLWLGPAAVLIIGVLTIVVMAKRQKKALNLSVQEQQRLDALLKEEQSDEQSEEQRR
ncbi:cystathionine gamma-synthase [Aliidiomarina sedimenti]|uniref:Cytochrome c-type biogenesis protein n=1 Tax=Aliidiomarina sedimenti TaxID=1933879 RepID=A0ABY0BZ55_9GAMM|nr:cytochrome c-type biogenesis protein [Aliidiomarina sedimenti]RUO29928.1 cystathionine gamma-synthase [Aliidiomarina sedimenti]